MADASSVETSRGQSPRLPGTPPDPGTVTSVFANFRDYLMGWDSGDRAGAGVDCFRSGLDAPQFNGVVRLRPGVGVERAVAGARSALAGVPWWWWVGPDSAEGTAGALARHGGRLLAVMPVMTRPLGQPGDDARAFTTAGQEEALSGLRVEAVGDDRLMAEVVRTYRTSMGLGPALQAGLLHRESRREDNADVIRLAAVLDGRVVGSTVVVAAHGVAGIFLVHVAERCRRRGVGTALTAAALRVGQDRGMRLAALVASAAGEPLYRRAKFARVSEYRLFTFADRDSSE